MYFNTQITHSYQQRPLLCFSTLKKSDKILGYLCIVITVDKAVLTFLDRISFLRVIIHCIAVVFAIYSDGFVIEVICKHSSALKLLIPRV